MTDNGYTYLCEGCGALNHVSPIRAFRAKYEYERCWRCRSVNEVNTSNGKVVGLV